MELCGTAVVFWGDTESKGVEKTEDVDDIQGDYNKETYIQRVVLLEQGTRDLTQPVMLCIRPIVTPRTNTFEALFLPFSQWEETATAGTNCWGICYR